MSSQGSFWDQVQQRRLLPLTVGYFGLGWALVELTDFMVNRYAWPDRLIDLSFAAIAWCLPLALLLIWKIGAPGAARFAGRDFAMLGAASLFGFAGLYLQHINMPVGVEAAAQAPAKVAPTSYHEQVSYLTIFPFAVDGSAEDAWLADALPLLAEYDLAFDPRFGAQAALSSGVSGQVAIVQRMGAKDLASAPLAVRRRAAIAQGYRALLTGTVAHKDGKLQVHVELHRLRPDQALGPFELTAVDVWDAVDQIAALVRRELPPPKAKAEGNDPALKSVTTESIEALHSFVDGQVKRLKSNDYSAAGQDFAAAETIDPTFVFAAYMNLSMRSVSQKPGQTIADYEAILPRVDVLPPSYRYSIQHYLARAKDDKPAVRRVLQAWAMALPWDRTPGYGLAFLALEDNPDDAQALQQLHRMAMASGAAPEMAQQSLNFKRRGLLDDALQLAQAAVELDGSDFSTRTRLAEILQARGELDAAAEQLATANVLRPDLITGLLMQARLSFDRGDWNGALQQLDAIDERTSTRPEQRDGWLRAYIEMLRVLGRLRAAEPLIDEWINLRQSIDPLASQPTHYVSYAGLKFQLYGEAGARAWLAKAPLVPEAHLQAYYASTGDAALALEMRNVKSLRAAQDALMAAYAAMGQLGAERAISHWDAYAKFFDQEAKLSVSQAQAVVNEFARLVRSGMQTESNLVLVKYLAIENALDQQDGDAARTWLTELLRSTPGEPELLLFSAQAHQLRGERDAATAAVDKALEAWDQADPEFKLAEQARELRKNL